MSFSLNGMDGMDGWMGGCALGMIWHSTAQPSQRSSTNRFRGDGREGGMGVRVEIHGCMVFLACLVLLEVGY